MLPPPLPRFRSAAIAAAARRSTRTSARSARRSCRSAGTATTSAFSAAAQAQSRAGGARAAVPDAQPPVSSRLLLQRDAGRAARQPRAVVVPERRVSHAQAADRARRVSAAARRVRGRARPGSPGEEATKQVPPALLEEVFALNEELDEIRELRASGAPADVWKARLERARGPIERKRDEHEAQLQELSARWDALLDAHAGIVERRPVLEALRERVLERNYINNLLAGIEKGVDASSMSKVVGIDLGTTNSLVALREGRRPGRHSRSERRRAGAVDRLGGARRHDLRRPRSAAAPADRRRAHRLFGEALHGQRAGRRQRRGEPAAVPRRPAKPAASSASASATASSRRPRFPPSSCAS